MLSCLSTEALAAVIGLLDGRDIGRLWSCGDSVLNRRLGSGGCVKEFRLELQSLFPTKWPSLVRHFTRLQHFEVSYARGEAVEGDWIPNYSELSQSVRKIVLCFPKDTIAFFEALRSGFSFPHLEELKEVSTLLIRISKTPEEAQQIINSMMALLPPSLYSLTFTNWSSLQLPPHTSTWPRQLRQTNVMVTPPDFEHQQPDQGSSPAETDLLSTFLDFPPSLEVLQMQLSSKNMKLVFASIRWPSNLLSLSLWSQSAVAMSIADVQGLPRTLTCFNAKLSSASFSVEFLQALPPKLTELNLRGVPQLNERTLILLPRTLTKSSNLPTPTAENIKLFPPSITYLSSAQTYDDLPSGIRTIMDGMAGMDGGPKPPNHTWKRLPDSLTHLPHVHPDYLAEHTLPLSLRKLWMYQTYLTEHHVERFASTNITQLTLSGCTVPTKQLFQHLPRCISILSLVQVFPIIMGDEECKNLPETLLNLTLSPTQFTCQRPFHSLPSGLEFLSLRIDTLEEACFDPKRFAKLHSLNITLTNLSPGIARQFVTNIPRRVKRFVLSSPEGADTEITDEDLESLPPGLTNISLGQARNVTGRWLSRMPQFLDDIWIGTRVIAPKEGKKRGYSVFEN